MRRRLKDHFDKMHQTKNKSIEEMRRASALNQKGRILMRAMKEAHSFDDLEKFDKRLDENLTARIKRIKVKIEEGENYSPSRKKTVPNMITPEMYGRMHCVRAKADLNEHISEL
jgi:hypothetical protein